MLLCLLDDSQGVCRPGMVVRDHGAQMGEGVEPLHTVAMYVEGTWICSVFPEVQGDFFCLYGVC